MSLEIGLWRARGKKLERLASGGIGDESELEDYIESDPRLLGETLLLIGRQVRTAHGGIIDLLAVDSEGAVHTIELKRDRTPRDVVAQALDYSSWVATLDRAQIVEIFESYRAGSSFDTAFVEAFGGDAPDELNAAQIITIVAASVDPATARIVSYLNETFDVPINVVFFRYFNDEGQRYLARSWLLADEVGHTAKATSHAGRTREPWNGNDWYAAFGTDSESRSWDDAHQYGFISAGGGDWYSRSLRNVPVGARVFVCIPKTGYVAVGHTTRMAAPFASAVVDHDGGAVPLSSLPLRGRYSHSAIEGQDTDEYVVSVDWVHAVAESAAVWQTGMFANQHSACKLRHSFTIETVERRFGIAES